MKRGIRRFEPKLREDFFKLHCEANGGGWCNCVAWWVNTWEGWGDRTAEENRNLRISLLDQGQYDGYLLYADGRPVGWCQVGPRDRLEKLVNQFKLTKDSKTWAISCFFIAKSERASGHSSYLLTEVMKDLRQQGIKRVEAFPKRGENLDALDLWNGPEQMFIKQGFKVVQDDPKRPVLALDL